MAVDDKVKVHWTHKLRIKKLYKEGFTNQELAKMYNISISKASSITRGLERPERI